MEAFTVDMTAAEMIQVIATGSVSDRPAKDEERSPALVLLPGSMGYGPSLAAFGAELGKVAHVIAIRYPDLASVLAGQGSVDVMADSAMDQINAADPRGKMRFSLIHWAGASHLMVTRLIAAGRSVEFLGILDTSIEASESRSQETLSRTLQRNRSHRATVHRLLCRAVAKCVARLHGEVGFYRFLDETVWNKFATTRFILRLELRKPSGYRPSGAGSRVRNGVCRSQGRFSVATAEVHLHSDGIACSRKWTSFRLPAVISISSSNRPLTVNGPVIKRAITSSFSRA